MDASVYDELYRGIAKSARYKRIVDEIYPNLPQWFVPLSQTDLPQLEQIARDLGRPHTIVDIGCGLGGVLRWMCERSSAAGIGIDYSPVAVDAARREHAFANLRFHVGTASATGIETSTCDGLVSIDVLQFTEPHSAVREIARVLQRGGRAAIRTWELREGVEVPLETIQRDYTLIFRTNGLVPVDKKTLRDAQEHAAPFWRAVVRDASQLKNEMGASSEMLIAEATHMLEIAARPPRVDKVYYLCEKP